MNFRDSETAFNDAIASGLLSADSAAENFAGYYMYMHTAVYGDDLEKAFRTLQETPVRVIAWQRFVSWFHRNV